MISVYVNFISEYETQRDRKIHVIILTDVFHKKSGKIELVERIKCENEFNSHNLSRCATYKKEINKSLAIVEMQR